MAITKHFDPARNAWVICPVGYLDLFDLPQVGEALSGTEGADILFDCAQLRYVDSAVLKLVPLDKPAVATKDEKLFFSLVRAAFNMRRKTLVNALGPVLGSSMSKDEITALVEAAGLDARIRGERLSLAEYAKLADLAAEKLSN